MAQRNVIGAIGIAVTAVAGGSLLPATVAARTAPATLRRATSQDVAGNWSVVPRRMPDSIATGGIPRSFRPAVEGAAVLLRVS